MKKLKPWFFLGLALVLNLNIEAQLRATSAPFISGDTFRSFSDHLYDETSTIFNPELVSYGDVIFVKTDLIGDFFKNRHPYIKNPYVLITHNSDYAMPGPFREFLDDPKILAWYAQNIEEYAHPKLINLPIGLANRYWEHGSIEVVNKVKSRVNEIARDHLIYLNIAVATYPKERAAVYEQFKNQRCCFKGSPKPFEKYLEDIASCKFVLSPRGNGIDCHRTWEALYMGAIPVVKTSTLDPMYEGLPVVIVEDWNEVTEEFLERMYYEMSQKTYSLERINASYWYNELTKYKRDRLVY